MKVGAKYVLTNQNNAEGSPSNITGDRRFERVYKGKVVTVTKIKNKNTVLGTIESVQNYRDDIWIFHPSWLEPISQIRKRKNV